MSTAEDARLDDARQRKGHWKRWGPYVAERAWGTVREDYSPDGTAWTYFPFDAARSRAYRWNEDGIAGICDRHQVVCLALAQIRTPLPPRRFLRARSDESPPLCVHPALQGSN